MKTPPLVFIEGEIPEAIEIAKVDPETLPLELGSTRTVSSQDPNNEAYFIYLL